MLQAFVVFGIDEDGMMNPIEENADARLVLGIEDGIYGKTTTTTL